MIRRLLQWWFNTPPTERESNTSNLDETRDNEEAPVRVLYDGEHIANLTKLSYDHPFQEYRIESLTSDTEKLLVALNSANLGRPKGETILRFGNDDSDYLFYTRTQVGMSTHDQPHDKLEKVTVRFFGPAHRFHTGITEE